MNISSGWYVLIFVFIFSLMIIPDAEAQKREWEKRDKWQNVSEIFRAMGVSEGSWVADLGAKDGYLTVRLARAVGRQGWVFAIDIDETALADLHKNLRAEKISNVTAVYSAPDNPMLPYKSLDAVVIVNAYHEMEDYQSILTHIKAALKPGGRLVLIEPIALKRRDASRKKQVSYHEIALDFAREDLEEAGFKVVETRDPFVERKHKSDELWLLIATRPIEQSEE